MCPRIDISEATYKKLQRLAVPLKDTDDSLVARLADAALAGVVYGVSPAQPDASQVALGDNDRLSEVSPDVDLTHTRILKACFGGHIVENANWNRLAQYAHRRAFEKLGSFEELTAASSSNLRDGKFEEKTFTYVEGIGISIQDKSANGAWESILLLAKKLDMPVKVDFEWRNKPEAARPGESATVGFKTELC